MHHTTSPINQFTLIGPNPAFPFSVPPNDAGYPGLAPGAGWWPYAPAGGSMMGTMAGFPWVPLAGSPFLLPPSYPVPGFFPALGAYVGAPSEDNQELFPQLETAADESFPFVEKSAPGLQLSDDSPGALSGAPPSIYSVPSPIPDHYLQIIPPVPPTDAPLTYRCPEPGCTKAFKKACSLKYVSSPACPAPVLTHRHPGNTSERIRGPRCAGTASGTTGPRCASPTRRVSAGTRWPSMPPCWRPPARRGRCWGPGNGAPVRTRAACISSARTTCPATICGCTGWRSGGKRVWHIRVELDFGAMV